MAAIADTVPVARTRAASRRTAFYVLLFLFGMVVLWAVLCAISQRSPDRDNMEELVWASSFEWGYYKHPPVPAWFMYGLTSLFGRPIWLTFLAGQLCSALALWFVWKLGCEFTSPRRALIAMLMVSVTAYFSVRATLYNHNSVQTWSIMASTWLYYRALRHGRRSDWLWLGAACGMAFITKYSALIQFAAFFVFFARHRYWRDRAVLKGVALALLTFSVVVAPHIYWLFHHGFGPLFYADQSILPPTRGHATEVLELLDFLNTQLGRMSPMLVAWGAVFLWNRRAASKAGVSVADGAAPRYARALSAWDRSFLLLVGVGPVLLTVVVSGLLGSSLDSSWASTFFVLFGFYTYWWLRGDERVNLRRTAVVVVAIQVLMAVGYAAGRGPLAYYTGRTADSTYPGEIISRKMQDIWHQYVPGAPLTLVAASTWLGGNIAVHAGPGVNVLIDGSLRQSPWLKSGDAMRCGMLVAFSDIGHGASRSAALHELYGRAPYKGVLQQRWSSPRSPVIVIHWAVIPPGEDCAAGWRSR